MTHASKLLDETDVLRGSAAPALRAAVSRLPGAGRDVGSAGSSRGHKDAEPSLLLASLAVATAHIIDTLIAAAKSSCGGGAPPGGGQSDARTPTRAITPSTPLVNAVRRSAAGASIPSSTLGARNEAFGGMCVMSTKHVSLVAEELPTSAR